MPPHECKHESEFDTLRADLGEIKAALKDLGKAIYIGNGVPPMMARLDRLEQAQKRRDKWYWLLAGSAVSMFVTTLITALMR